MPSGQIPAERRRRRRIAWTFLAPLILTLFMVPSLLAGCGGDPEETTSTSTTATTTAEPEIVTVRLTEEDDGTAIEVPAGSTIELTLQINPSTGFSWEMQDADPEASLLEQVGEPEFVSDDPESVGAGGLITYTFRAVDAGEMIIFFAYLGPDDIETPERTFEVTLTVE